MKINTSRIGKFLKSLNEAEYIYLVNCARMRDNIQTLVRNGISGHDLCNRFGISLEQYDDFISGNYQYTLKDMATLNATFLELEIERVKKQASAEATSE